MQGKDGGGKEVNLESMQKPVLNGANGFFQGTDSKIRKKKNLALVGGHIL